jgi:hypothetical protein
MMAETSHDELQEWTTLMPWRRSRLRHAGCDAELAGSLAADMRYDLHAVLDLIDRGCPPHLAARILAPQDAPGP